MSSSSDKIFVVKIGKRYRKGRGVIGWSSNEDNLIS